MARKARAGDWVSKVREWGWGWLWEVSWWCKGVVVVKDGTYQAHGLAEEVDDCLIGDGAGVGQEEVAQGDVEEADGGEDGLG